MPSGGILVPTVGVGGHCLPKDGILLWWRKIESGADTSNALILESRKINDASPAETTRLAERSFGSLDGKRVALLGVAYRFDSEDTRNSPTLYLAKHLLAKGCQVTLHDPYVKLDDQNLERFGLTAHFTRDLGRAVADAEVLFFCTGHAAYKDGLEAILAAAIERAGRGRRCKPLSAWPVRQPSSGLRGDRAGHRSRRPMASLTSWSSPSASWSAAWPTKCRVSSSS